MRPSSGFLALTALLLSSTGLSGLTFTQNPSLVKQSDTAYIVGFAVSESTDVEVSIVSITDSSLVRHLAAGKLGPNAPAPLVPNSLAQTLTWDGRDDFRKAAIGSFSVRVRANMRPVLDRYVDRTTRGKSSAYTSSTPVSGLSVDGQGNLYLLGFYNIGSPLGSGPLTLRAYDASTGKYRRMLWPFPAGLDKASLAPYGILDLGGEGYQMKTAYLPFPMLSVRPFTSLPNYSGAGAQVLMASRASSDRLLVMNYPWRYNTGTGFAEVGSTGAYLSSGSLSFVTSPAFPAYTSLTGPLYLYPMPDNQTVLMSGFYVLGTDTLPVDTGFWRDGCVYKVNKTTGAASLFLELNRDTMPKTPALRRSVIGPATGHPGSMAAIHGVAADDSGRVFVCDRLHNRIGVYGAAGNLIKAVPVDKPDLVEVNRATGELYVSTRDFSGRAGYISTSLKLYKFSDWRAAPAKMDSLSIAVGAFCFMTDMNTLATKAFMAVNQKPAQSVIWWAGVNRNVIGIRDDGAKLVQFIDFADSSNLPMFNFDRIAVDRKKEQVYIQNGFGYMSKIESWSNPALVQCSTATGALLAGDMTVSPGGFLYARISNNSGMNGGWNGPIRRFTTAHRHVSAPFAGKGSDTLCMMNGGWYGAGFADRGFDIGIDGRVVLHQAQHARRVTLMDSVGTLIDDSLISPLPGNNSSGVKVDRDGNVYVGALLRPAGHVKPAGYEADTAYDISVGSIIKFPAGQRGSVTGTSPATRVANNASRVYARMGFAPYSGSHPMSSMSVCVCRAPKFDLDFYGRIYVPNAITGRVAVLDNNDNLIARFGEYGNYDAQTGPGAGFIWPVGAAVSEDFIYITDMVNQRLARVRMNFELDNMPGLTDNLDAGRAAVRTGARPLFSAAPNPFTPSTAFRFTGLTGEGARISILDVQGRLVRSLAADGPDGAVSWDGRDFKGRPLAAGFYVARLISGASVVETRLLLVR